MTSHRQSNSYNIISKKEYFFLSVVGDVKADIKGVIIQATQFIGAAYGKVSETLLSSTNQCSINKKLMQMLSAIRSMAGSWTTRVSCANTRCPFRRVLVDYTGSHNVLEKVTTQKNGEGRGKGARR